MEDSGTPELDQLIRLAEEAEKILANSIGTHDIRHACALARGYLELIRDYHEPVRVEDLERVVARMRALLDMDRPPPPVKLTRRNAKA